MFVNVSHLAADVVDPRLRDAGVHHHGIDQLKGVPPDAADHCLLEVDVNLDTASTAALTEALAHALLVLLDNLNVLVHTLGGDLGTLALVAEINQSEISIKIT